MEQKTASHIFPGKLHRACKETEPYTFPKHPVTNIETIPIQQPQTNNPSPHLVPDDVQLLRVNNTVSHTYEHASATRVLIYSKPTNFKC